MANEKVQNNRRPMGGPGRGPGGRFMMLNEKPKNVKKVVSRLLKYIGAFKVLFIILIIVVILSTLATLESNIAIKDLVESLGSYDIINHSWVIKDGVTQLPIKRYFITHYCY